MFNFLKKFRLVIILVLFIILAFILGVSFGRKSPNFGFNQISGTSNIVIKNDGISLTDESIDMTPFWEVWKLLDNKYVATKKPEATTTSQDRIWGAIQGMTNTLDDPYTVFLPPDDKKDFAENISGNFEGVGMESELKKKF
jgi:carboxyl-terminal processing protease